MARGEVINLQPESLRRVLPFYEDSTLRVDKELLALRNSCSRCDIQRLLDENNSQEILHDGNAYSILNNDCNLTKFASRPYYTRIVFVRNDNLIEHMDGYLQDTETDAIYYFIAINSENMNIHNLEIGSQVSYSDEYHGMCEAILHRSDGNGTITDIRDRFLLTRYVELRSISNDQDINILEFSQHNSAY